MKALWKNIYSKMLNEFDRCSGGGIPEIKQAEDCYQVAIEYWLHIKTRFVKRVMLVDSEEIEFFKEIKPQFTAYIEYYLILNQALLFTPVDPVNLQLYWEEEMNRFQRFHARNRAFVDYYESGLRDRDMEFFLLRKNAQSTPPQERIYDDADCRTSHDCLVRGLIACRMYRDYVQRKLIGLSEQVK